MNHYVSRFSLALLLLCTCFLSNSIAQDSFHETAESNNSIRQFYEANELVPTCDTVKGFSIHAVMPQIAWIQWQYSTNPTIDKYEYKVEELNDTGSCSLLMRIMG